MTDAGDRVPARDEAPPACPLCGSTHRIVDPVLAETHCSECGLVFDGTPIVATAPAPAEATGSEGSGRGIGPFVRPGGTKRALGSTLSLARDGQGKRLDWHRRYEFQHLKRVMQRQTSRTVDGPLDRSAARGEIQTAGELMGLPAVVLAEAEHVYREAKVRGLFRGRSLPASVGACIYAACRRYSIPRTLGEVAQAVGTRRSDVGRTFKVVQRGAGLPIPGVGTKAFLTRYAQELALSPRVRSTVETMLDQAREDPELSGLSPHGLVAALIYLAAEQNGEHRSRAQVARVSTVTEVTLRSTSRLVEKVWGRAGAPHESP
ncbi:MAG TPA: transcription initiation factor IIB family protein [Thermoplasmata archaeon]|nr:transcription initiation factor IIB family protein [Thermoplasmata archaeon]